MKKTIIFSLVLVAALVASMTVFCSIRQTDALFKSNLEALTSGESVTPDEYVRGQDGFNWKSYRVKCSGTYDASSSFGISLGNNNGVNANAPIPNTPVSAGVNLSSNNSVNYSNSSSTHYDESEWDKIVCGNGWGLCLDKAPDGHPCAS